MLKAYSKINKLTVKSLHANKIHLNKRKYTKKNQKQKETHCNSTIPSIY